MAISLRSITQAKSVRQQALNQNLTTDGSTPYTPFSLRELITPQYQIGQSLDPFGENVTFDFKQVSLTRTDGNVTFNATFTVSAESQVRKLKVENVRVVFEDDNKGFLDTFRLGTINRIGITRDISVSLSEAPKRVRLETGTIQLDMDFTSDSEGNLVLNELYRTENGSYVRWPRALRAPYQEFVESSREFWQNWVKQHGENRTEYRPTSRAQLLASVVNKVQSNGRIRAVGSGHSHSNAPEAPEHFIDLNPAEPEEDTDEALNRVLDHNGWLKDDSKLQQLYDDRDHGDRETHPFDSDHLKRVEAGVVLRRLNRHILHENGYALKNMGSFDGQTVAGAVNTSTHGTGVNLASLADSVESVEIATVPESASGNPIVRLYRIEPSDGITDREAFERATASHEMELIQDDDIFYSTVVGYGCMGVAYAYTLHVRDSYWLKEETKLMTWSDLTSELENSNNEVTEASVESFLTKDGCRHTQILVNIAADQVPPAYLHTHKSHGIGRHETGNDPLCLVKRHFEVVPSTKPDYWDNPAYHIGDNRWPPERTPKTLRYIGKDLPIHLLKPNFEKPALLHNGLFHSSVNNAPFFEGFNSSAWYVALRRLRDGGNKASETYNPEPPEPPTITTEVGVKLENLVDAVNEARHRITMIDQDIEISDKSYEAKGFNVFFPAPMGIRFTAASDHYLSPERRIKTDDDGEEVKLKTAMLEVPLPIYGDLKSGRYQVPSLTYEENRKYVVEPALTDLHNHLVFTGNSNIQFDARPHMGKHNTIGDGWLKANYPKYDSNRDDETAWLDVYNRFNAFGTFNNEFTKQLGIDN